MKLQNHNINRKPLSKGELAIRILLPILYGIFYVAVFSYLEKRPVDTYHVIKMQIDFKIPFCEYFIIPYMLWFLYIAGTVALFIFLDRKDYIRLCFTLGVGMTVFLAVSYFMPNMQPLRPDLDRLARDNIFLDVVKALYKADTCTNVFPSIHVYNSLAADFAIQKSRQLKNQKVLRVCSHILCISIILSTMFLKQHSAFDVLTGMAMAASLYWLVYYLPETKAGSTLVENLEFLKG